MSWSWSWRSRCSEWISTVGSRTSRCTRSFRMWKINTLIMRKNVISISTPGSCDDGSVGGRWDRGCHWGLQTNRVLLQHKEKKFNRICHIVNWNKTLQSPLQTSGKGENLNRGHIVFMMASYHHVLVSVGNEAESIMVSRNPIPILLGLRNGVEFDELISNMIQYMQISSKPDREKREQERSLLANLRILII